MVDVSFVIPCYNHGKYLPKALESIFNQKGNFSKEIIIVNDGSTDNETSIILNSLKDPLIKVINQENQGLAKARNNGIKFSTGEYILPLDSDNYIPLDYVIKNLKLFKEDPEVGIVYTDMIIFRDNSFLKRRVKPGQFAISTIILKNYIDACMMYKRIVFDILEGYDEKMPYMGVEDWEFNIRAYKKNIVMRHNDKNYFYYRDVPDSMIKKAEDKKQILIEYMIKKHLDLYAIHLPQMIKELSYAQRKPFLYFIKKITKNII